MKTYKFISPTTLFCSLLLLFLANLTLAQESCDYQITPPQTPEEQASAERWARYRERLAFYTERLPSEPDTVLYMPVEGVSVASVADTWGAPRGTGRTHEGQDIFAPRGTPIFSAAPGYVYRVGTSNLGGNVVWVIGAGGRRYYYAHLDSWADIEEGQAVTVDTLLGYVGNTGNAVSTPPHLHFGIYSGSRRSCDRAVHDPLPLLANRQSD